MAALINRALIPGSVAVVSEGGVTFSLLKLFILRLEGNNYYGVKVDTTLNCHIRPAPLRRRFLCGSVRSTISV